MSQVDLSGSQLGGFAASPHQGLRAVRRTLRGLVGAEAAARPWTLTQTMATVGGLMAFAGLASLAWWWTGAVVPWDSKNHFYPMFRFLGDALQRGEWPIWNPYHFGGHPTVADPQSLLFTPTMLVLAWLAPFASMQLFDVIILGHLVAGGLGVIGLFRRRGWRPVGALLAAMIFMLGGAASSRLQHTGMIISYAFFPLALLTLEIALETRKIRWGVVFGVSAALMALGRDQVAFLLCLSLIGAVLVQFAAAAQASTWLRQRLLLLCAMAVTGASLIAVPALLTLQFLGQSNRPEIAYGVAAAGSLAPVNFLTMIAPNVFGSLDWNYEYWGPGYETMAEADWTDRAVNYLFIGTLPLLLVVWHGLAGGRLLAKGLRLYLLIGIAAGAYSVGHYTPVFEFIFDHVPGVSLYRRPADATFLLNIAFAFAAGYLLHRYVADGLPNPFRSLPGWLALGLVMAAAVVVGTVVAQGIAFSATGDHIVHLLGQLSLAAVIALCGAAIVWVGARRDRRHLAAIIVVTVTAGELLWRNAASSLNAEPASRYSVYDRLTPTEQAGFNALHAELAAQTDRGRHPRVEILGLGGAWQNASMVLGIENTLGYNPLRIAEYERAVGPGENAGDPNLRHFPGTFRGYKCKLASLLGLEYLVLDRPLTRLPRHIPRPKAVQLYAANGMYIYKLGTSAERAYLATKVTPVNSEEIISQRSVPEFDRAHEALIDEASMRHVRGDYGTMDGTDGTPSANSHVTIAAYHDDSILIEVDTDRPGVLILHDLYYPGWEVTVDGEKKPVLRANILFRGVEVPTGHHLIEFEFQPFSLANLAEAAGHVRPQHPSED